MARPLDPLALPPPVLPRGGRLAAALGVLLALGALGLGCDDPVVQSTGAPPPPRRGAAALPSASASASAERHFSQEDFTPSDRNRDPFRSYAEIFIANKKIDPSTRQISAIASNYALDELKLVAIVSSGAQPRAMFVDPQGMGHIVTVGQRLGRSELVRATGVNGPEYDVNWKVDRIRDGDVVFVRDTTSGNVPTSSRVVALRVDDGPGRSR